MASLVLPAIHVLAERLLKRCYVTPSISNYRSEMNSDIISSLKASISSRQLRS